MPKIPTYDAQVGLEAGKAAPKVEYNDAPAKAEALAASTLNAALQQTAQIGNTIADHIEKRAAEVDEFDTSMAFEKIRQAQSEDDTIAQREIGESGDGFAAGRRQAFDTRMGEFLKGIKNPELAKKYALTVEKMRTNYNSSVDDFEYKQKQTYYENGLGTKFNSIGQAVQNDPTTLESGIAEYNAAVDNSPLTSQRKAELKRANAEKLREGAFQGDLASGSLARARSTGQIQSTMGDATFGSILQQETGFLPEGRRASAVSPAGALGRSQLMPATAREQAQLMGNVAVSAMTDGQLKAYFATPAGDKVNQEIGRAYFNRMAERYNGDLEAAVVAYNGGPARADKWLAAGRNDAVLPAETRQYRVKVTGRVTMVGNAGSSNDADGEMTASNFRSQAGYTWQDLRNDRFDGGHIQTRLVHVLDEATALNGGKFTITSGFRPADHPEEAKKEKPGQHTHGNAADISLAGMSDEQKSNAIANFVAAGATGIGHYPPGSSGAGTIHVDVRDTPGKGPGGLATWYGSGKNARSGGNEPWFDAGIAKGLAMREQGVRAQQTAGSAIPGDSQANAFAVKRPGDGAAGVAPVTAVGPDGSPAGSGDTSPAAAVQKPVGAPPAGVAARPGNPIVANPFEPGAAGSVAGGARVPGPAAAPPQVGAPGAKVTDGPSKDGLPPDPNTLDGSLAALATTQPDRLPPRRPVEPTYQPRQFRAIQGDEDPVQYARRQRQWDANERAKENASQQEARAATANDRADEVERQRVLAAQRSEAVADINLRILRGDMSFDQIETARRQGIIGPREATGMFESYERRQAKLKAAETEAKSKEAVIEQTRQEEFSRTSIGVQRGEVDDDGIEAAYRSGIVKTSTEYSTIMAQRAKYLKDREEKVGAVEKLNSGATFSPFDAKDKKTVDDAYQTLAKLAGDDRGKQLALIEQIYAKSGVMPTSVGQAIRGALVAQDPAMAGGALQLTANLMARNPNVFAGVDGGEEIARNGVAFRHYIQDLGYSADDATKRVLQDNDPKFKDSTRRRIEEGDLNRELKAIRLDGAKIVGKALDDTTSFYNWPQMLGGYPAAGASPREQTRAVGDYADLFREEYLRNGGNAEMAKAQASDQMKRTWGVSRYTGASQGVLMKYPVEKAYPPVNGSWDYIGEQAAADLKRTAKVDVAPTDIVLVPDEAGRTHSGFQNQSQGATPYLLFYWRTTSNGQRVLENANSYFTADPKVERDKKLGEVRDKASERVDMFRTLEASMPR